MTILRCIHDSSHHGDHLLPSTNKKTGLSRFLVAMAISPRTWGANQTRCHHAALSWFECRY